MKSIVRMLRKLYSGPYQAALVFSFTLVAALTIAVGTWVISSTINNYLSRVMNERVARDAHLAVTFYDLRLREISSVVSQLSSDPTIADNLEAASGDPGQGPGRDAGSILLRGHPRYPWRCHGWRTIVYGWQPDCCHARRELGRSSHRA
jgi:hypothetical protein